MCRVSRAAIVAQLKSKLGDKAAVTYEKAIYDMIFSKYGKENIAGQYPLVAYEKCGEIMASTTKEERAAILKDIKAGVVGWDSCIYEGQRQRQAQLNRKLQDKGKLVKGAFYCRDKIRCKSDECYSFQAQTRGGDEGMTTFVICAKCGLRYKFG